MSPVNAPAASPSAVRPRPGRWSLLLPLLAVAAVLSVAGVPGRERTAGDGSGKLRRGWAADQARAAGWTATGDGTFVPPPAPDVPAAPR